MPEVLVEVLGPDLAIAYAIVIAAGVTRGFTGFVAGLVNVALLTMLYGPVEAIALTSLFGIVSSVMLLRRTMGIVKWRETLPLGVGAAVAAPAGVALLLLIDAAAIKPAIGALVVACGIALFTGWRYAGPRNSALAACIGAVSGGVTGLTGSGGPLMVFYYLAAPDPVNVQRANISATVFVLALVMTASLILGDRMGMETIVRGALLFPGTMIGTLVGARLFKIAPDRIYRRIAQWAVIAMGTVVMVS